MTNVKPKEQAPVLGPLPEGMRLAGPTEPGASLYNSYLYLTQIFGLYAQAEKLDPTAVTRPVWAELGEVALRDLGEVFIAWETVLKQVRSAGGVVVDDPSVCATVERGCRRASVLVRRLDTWTPMSRWAGILLLCERRWQRLLTSLAAMHPGVAVRLAAVVKSGQDRQSRLVGLVEQYRSARRRIDANFFAVGDGEVGT